MYKFKSIFSITIITILLVSITFLDLDLFVDNNYSSKWYAFILMSICCGFFLLFDKPKVFFNKVLGLIILLIFYILIRGLLSDISIIEISILFSLFILLFFFHNDYILTKTINVIFIINAILMSLYGFLQYTLILPTEGDFHILGSYRNPSCLAGNLSFIFPLLFFFLRSHRVLSIIASLFIVSTVLLTESRAGILSILIVGMIYLFDNFPSRYNFYKTHILWGIILLTSVFCLYLFFIKQNSAIGRTLIWIVSSNVAMDNMLFGQGSYGFYKEYMLHQAKYFDKYPESNYSLLASNMMHTFNEYLLLTIKYGLLSLIIVIYIFTQLLKKIRFSSPYLLCIISIGIFAMFSYPFQYPITWVILLYCIVQISKHETPINQIYNIPIKYIKGAIFISICISCFFLTKDVLFEYKWHKLAGSSLKGQTEEVLPEYQNLYHSWNGNHLFLYNYASELNVVGENKKSLQILNATTNYWNDYDIQLLIADNFFKLKELEKAKEHYLLASKMCPNRFIPLYGLLKIYVEENNVKMITLFSENILKKDVKVPSTTINIIKNEAQNFLISNSSR